MKKWRMFRKKVIYFSTLFSTILRFIESSPLSFGGFVLGISSWILLRFFIENWLAGFPLDRNSIVPLFLNLFLSFWFSALLFVWFLSRMSKAPTALVARVVLFGFMGILLPPLIDFFLLEGHFSASFFIFDGLSGWSAGHGLPLRFLTFFGDRPDFGITYGVRVEVALFSLLMATYAAWKTRSRKRFLQTLLGAYSIFFLLGTLPSWITLAIDGWKEGFFSINDLDIASRFLTPQSIFSLPMTDFASILATKMSLVYSFLLVSMMVFSGFSLFPRKFLSMARNMRFPQLLYHSGLLCLGMGLAVIFAQTKISLDFFTLTAFVVMNVSVWLAWLAAVVVNDCFDVNIDSQTNPNRPLPTEAYDQEVYRMLGWIFFVLSILFAVSVSFEAAALLFIYQLLSWMYSAFPFRLKRFPVVATFVSALASWLIAVMGFLLVAPESSLAHFPFFLQWFFLVAVTIALPVKDLKDIPGDALDGVWTIPVLFGERRAKEMIGVGIWLDYIVSIAVFREPRLLFPSIIGGGVSYMLVVNARAKDRGWLTYRTIFWWLLGTVFIYGCFVAYFALSTPSS